MALFDLIGGRWAVGVLWTLSEIDPSTFRELQDKCESISPAVLNQRLKEIQAARLVHKTDSGYAVTRVGREIYQHLLPFGPTAKVWVKTLSD